MQEFRRLATVALIAGALAGIVLFALQQFTVVPLIKAAEAFEPEGHPANSHETTGWMPSEGWQRNSLTGLATVLTGIGLAAVLLGFAALARIPLTLRTGMLLGIAAFVCVNLAPSFGLPPQPPGTPVADVGHRQLWWVGAVTATATGLWLIVRGRKTWIAPIAGVLCIIAPHVLGAPQPVGDSVVPEALLRRFALASLLSMGLFWVLLGASGGYLLTHRFDLHATRK